MRKFTKRVSNVISKVALLNAKKEANSACVLFGYQPKVSKAVKRKLKGKL